MVNDSYDIVVVGGGLGGSSLARAMAEKGASVLVLESTVEFSDRVRGESIQPWGVAEAQEIGVYEAIMAAGGQDVPFWDEYAGPERASRRNLVETTPQGLPGLCVYHPAMQQRIIESAADAGASVVRGARVTEIQPGSRPEVTATVDGRARQISARLVVGADGRNSISRAAGRFEDVRAPEMNLVSGLLFDDMPADDTACHFFANPPVGRACLLFPQGQGRVRAYMIYHADDGPRPSGEADVPVFIESALQCGVPPDLFAGAKPAGPLATFDGAESQAKHPYTNGLALVGDAAGQSDPAWGQGLAITLRDARVLRGALLAGDDWDKGGHAYAEEHDRYFNVTLTAEHWFDEVLCRTGPEADALRQRVLPLWAEDVSRIPDVFFSGPDVELTEEVRRRMFGED